MRAVLLDTHAWVWSFFAEQLLSDPACHALTEADAVYVSPNTFCEIGQKVRISKWREMADCVSALHRILSEQGGFLAPFAAEICLSASVSEWASRDPSDRLIAATASATDQTLDTKDDAFAEVDGLRTVW